MQVQFLSWAPFDSQATAWHLLAHGEPRHDTIRLHHKIRTPL